MPSTKKLPACSDAYALAEALAHLCDDPHPENDSWRARCPNHHGKSDTSLSITPNDDRVLLKCFAECSTADIVHTLGLTMADLFVRQPGQPARQMLKAYDYYDAAGTLVHQTVRFEPKSFRQRRPDPANPGQFIWDLKTIEPVLYQLPSVLQAIQDEQPIYIVEGEKDADLLREKGLIATCNPMGAGKWRPSYTEALRNARVIILPDHDVPGKRHAEAVAQALWGVAKEIRLVDTLHTSAPGSDISDWIRAGGTREEFEAIVQATAVYTGHTVAPLGWQTADSPHATQPHQPSSPSAHDPEENAAWYQEEVLPYVNKRRIVEANDTTICAFLRNHSFWQGKLWWDDMGNKPMFGQDELSDYLITKIGAMFGKKHLLPIRTDRTLARCLTACCYEHKHDPLQHYLDHLPGWDGTARLETWLMDCAGVVNTAYNRFLSRILLVSMIARAYEPGCLYRNVIVFEGPEEFRKSSFVAALVPDKRWHLSLTSSFENKDVPMLIQGIWIAELSELDSLTRTEETRLKSFITETEDAYVPKWQLFRIAPKRRTIFVGTTNESNWLKSTTGNTRFWPVRIVHPLDVEQFVFVREQLYAEAKLWYYDHPRNWWEVPYEAQAQATLEREERRQASVYESDLALWLDTGRFQLAQQSPTIDPIPHETTWPEIASGFLRLDTPEKWKDIHLQKQIVHALKSLGWRQKILKRNGKSLRVWADEPTTPF